MAPDVRRHALTLVVPLYNEEERFVEHADELAAWIAAFPPGSELLLVDDGSSDGTAEVVQAFLSRHAGTPARLLRRPHAGKGAAVRAGLAQAHAPYAGFCDVDLSTPLEEFELILAAAQAAPVLAIGSRDTAASQLLRAEGPVRERLGKLYNRLVQLTLAPGIVDTQCGAKAAALPVWKELLAWCDEDGFAWDVEIVALARRLGTVVREVAVRWRHDDRSRVRVARDGAKMVAAVPRIMKNVAAVPKTVHADGEASGVFSEEQAATLIESDTGHWWFRSKGALVAAALRRHLRRGQRQGRLIDVGGGAGGVTTILGWKPDRLFSVDGSELLCRQARDRHALLAAVGVGEELPFPAGAFSVVTLLDVIEHLDDPGATLREAHRLLGESGLLVVNVPAHQWLWSRADEVLGHVRRYDRRLLRRQLEAEGFRILWMSHVFSWLVAPVWLRRRLAAGEQEQLGLDQRSAAIERAAMILTRLEAALTRWVSLPLGTSVMCVAAKVDRS